jgi:hypothetical protein
LGEANLSGTELLDANLDNATLIGANLSNTNLEGADLFRARLYRADLGTAKLLNATLALADLSDADLSNADLWRADLSQAYLSGATLFGTNLRDAVLHSTNLNGANLTAPIMSGALLGETIFANVDLHDTIGLDDCMHLSPSVIDFHTLSRSGNLPLSFLRGCGLADIIIDNLSSLRVDPIQFYSCFISYSSKDQMFVERLYADLQNKGVRCWFAPHDLRIGAKTWDAIDEAIRLRDKLLVILSEASIASDWVEDEVNKAHTKERERKETVLFPIRIDDAV